VIQITNPWDGRTAAVDPDRATGLGMLTETLMAPINALAVYCGSNAGNDPAYRSLAHDLGHALAARRITLVYGGGRVGLMGVVADAALAGGGTAIGIIPEHLARREVRQQHLTETVVVPSMHVRKQRMFDLADACLVLPGGLGTLDETIEVVTWRQLGLHDKPIVIVDPTGFWRPLEALVQHMIGEGFASHAALRLFHVARSLDETFAFLAAAPAPRLAAAAERT